jgi:hypothetical protein
LKEAMSEEALGFAIFATILDYLVILRFEINKRHSIAFGSIRNEAFFVLGRSSTELSSHRLLQLQLLCRNFT